jgi:hypothetical protein
MWTSHGQGRETEDGLQYLYRPPDILVNNLRSKAASTISAKYYGIKSQLVGIACYDESVRKKPWFYVRFYTYATLRN